MSLAFIFENVLVIALLAGLPAYWVWDSRDAVRPAHAVVLLVLALLLGAASALFFSWAKQAGPGWGALAPVMMLIGSGGLGVVLLSAGIMAAGVLAFRDELAVKARLRRRELSGEPHRPSFAPQSRREISTRLILALSIMCVLCISGIIHTMGNTSVPNHLRLLGLFRGPLHPRELSLATTPWPWSLQLGILVVVAIGCALWAVSEFRRHQR